MMQFFFLLPSTFFAQQHQYVTKKSPADIAKMEAYILFYRRKAPHRDEERARIAKFMKPNMEIIDKGLMVYISRLWICRFNHLTNVSKDMSMTVLTVYAGVFQLKVAYVHCRLAWTR
jgi:ubiquitin carboxyl-terminal hydrolase 20/33